MNFFVNRAALVVGVVGFACTLYAPVYSPGVAERIVKNALVEIKKTGTIKDVLRFKQAYQDLPKMSKENYQDDYFDVIQTVQKAAAKKKPIFSPVKIDTKKGKKPSIVPITMTSHDEIVSQDTQEENIKEERLKYQELQKQKEEQERLELERVKEEEQQRLEKERIEKERLEKERIERERLEKEKQEKLEKERIERERLEKERLEKERLEKERIERERLEREKQEQERIERERLERLEKERIEKESKRPLNIEAEDNELPEFVDYQEIPELDGKEKEDEILGYNTLEKAIEKISTNCPIFKSIIVHNKLDKNVYVGFYVSGRANQTMTKDALFDPIMVPPKKYKTVCLRNLLHNYNILVLHESNQFKQNYPSEVVDKFKEKGSLIPLKKSYLSHKEIVEIKDPQN